MHLIPYSLLKLLLEHCPLMVSVPKLLKDILTITQGFSKKNPKGIVADLHTLIPRRLELASKLKIPENIIHKIHNDLKSL